MNRTMGDLFDALCTTVIKLYMVQEEVFAAAREKRALAAETVEKLATLNNQRNKLMTAVDETFARGVTSGQVDVDARIKIT